MSKLQIHNPSTTAPRTADSSAPTNAPPPSGSGASSDTAPIDMTADIAIVPGRNKRELETMTVVSVAVDATHLGAEFVIEPVVHSLAAAAAPSVAVAGAAVTAIGVGLALYEMTHAIVHAHSEGVRDGLLGAAFGGAGIGGPGWAAGIASSLRRLSADERSAIRDALPPGIEQQQFDEAFGLAENARRDDPEAFQEAREAYMPVFHQLIEGYAAGVEGWDTHGRGEAFRSGRALGVETLRGPDGARIRAAARQVKLQGFEDAAFNRVDQHRFHNDAHYRSGVEHHSSVARRGKAALAAEYERLSNRYPVPQRGATGAPIAG